MADREDNQERNNFDHKAAEPHFMPTAALPKLTNGTSRERPCKRQPGAPDLRENHLAPSGEENKADERPARQVQRAPWTIPNTPGMLAAHHFTASRYAVEAAGSSPMNGWA